MKDGNYVYITLTKIKNINNYEQILPSLEQKKGFLYLDSGQYFNYILYVIFFFPKISLKNLKLLLFNIN